jgi:tRNA dimethylallyltransferase
MAEKPLLVCICGATATGKTDLAAAIAQELGTEIVSFDSVQVYKRLDIGTAKPTPEILKRVKHHLIDEIEPTESFTAGDFKKRAEELIAVLAPRSKPIVLVGGTGFYLQALLKGMYEVPQVSDELKARLNQEAKTKGNLPLYNELKTLDAEYAAKIHVNDTYRILRALELLRSGSKKVSEIQKAFTQAERPYQIVEFGLVRPRDELAKAVEARTNHMIKSGLIEETRSLLKDFPQGLKPLESVGYKETVAFLKGELPIEELQSAIVKSTMQLAKRQMTWFKRDIAIEWHNPQAQSLESLTKSLVRKILPA